MFLLKKGKGVRVESGLRSHLVQSILLHFGTEVQSLLGGLPNGADVRADEEKPETKCPEFWDGACPR